MELKKQIWSLLTKEEKKEYIEKFNKKTKQNDFNLFMDYIIWRGMKFVYFISSFLMLLGLFAKDYIPNYNNYVQNVILFIYGLFKIYVIWVIAWTIFYIIILVILIYLQKRWIKSKNINIIYNKEAKK